MLKCKATKKEIKENYKNIICIGYCELQYLLNYENARFYTANAYGWGADIYEIDYNTVIVTGYESFGNIRPDYEISKKFNKEAEKIYCNIADTYEENKKKISKLLNKYIEEVIKGGLTNGN